MAGIFEFLGVVQLLLNDTQSTFQTSFCQTLRLGADMGALGLMLFLDRRVHEKDRHNGQNCQNTDNSQEYVSSSGHIILLVF
ncbi:MAG: hypothetical protein ACD_39C01874G0002 [uncultured bacterium]|nr:MAG: hypothetical protein ACD_39C01874G0002 [uncultured bacterium]